VLGLLAAGGAVAASGSIASVGLGLVAATTWGGSDFAGGYGARRYPALLIVAAGHVVTLAVLLAVCGFSHLPLPHRTEFLEGAVGGLEGALALAAFYRALAMGAMGLTAALTGLLTALVPVLFALGSEGFPAPLAAVGLLFGCLAICLIAYRPGGGSGHDTRPAALILGAVSGVGFGVQLVLLKLASNGGVLWALTSARIGGVLGVLAILLFLPGAGRGWRGFWRMGILAGGLDTLGNLGYTLAAHRGRLDIAAMVSSLYPGFTILLAAMILRERPTRRQTMGMAVALASVVLLSL
jgi:drug/metabolite transporter (DMT)-like permease